MTAVFVAFVLRGGRVWGSSPRLMLSKAQKSAGATAPNSAGVDIGLLKAR